MKETPNGCYGCSDREPTFVDTRTGRRFCHSCIEVLASWENDGCPEPDLNDYAEWIGEENVWRVGDDAS